jgi:bacillithiol system protein YtxJ
MPKIIDVKESKLPDTCLVYKHSTACPLSATAAVEIKAMPESVEIHWINVIEQRPISNWVESHYGIRHESPQLLKIKDGKVVDSWSHHDVKRDLV